MMTGNRSDAILEKKTVRGKAVLGWAERGSTIKIELSLPRALGVRDLWMEIVRDDTGEREYLVFSWDHTDFTTEVYRATLETEPLVSGENGALLFYKYCAETAKGKIDIGRSDLFVPTVMTPSADTPMFQLLIYEKPDYAPGMNGGVMYQIFVDRFARSGKSPIREDVVFEEDWNSGALQYADMPGGDVDNNLFFGGDLYGIAEKLDYIKSLGTTVIYLSPVFEAYSNHKYDTGDYTKIDSMFGGEDAFAHLLEEAEKRGIRIILDGVFNHTGSDSVYFNKNGRYKSLGAYQSRDSEYYPWYTFRDYPDRYDAWWGVKILPRVRSDAPSFRAFLFGENGVIRTRMRQGILGFRIDVADELTDGFLAELRKTEREESEHPIVIGEVWEDASNKVAYGTRRAYLRGRELDSVMNYPLRDALIAYLKYGDGHTLLSTLAMLEHHYPPHVFHRLMNFLGTHDTDRILTVLGGDTPDGATNDELFRKRMTDVQRTRAIELLKIAYTLLATLPGVPCIFYGDEAGMEGYRDPFNRRPYPWGREEGDLLRHYRKIGEIRTKNAEYTDGALTIEHADENLLLFRRGEQMFTAVNRGDAPVSITLEDRFTDCLTGKAWGPGAVTLPPLSSFIFKKRKPRTVKKK